MIIECGPRPLLLRGRDWQVLPVVMLNGDVYRHVVTVANGHMTFGLQPASVRTAAMEYGFDVAVDGLILNWGAVPHLWEVAW